MTDDPRLDQPLGALVTAHPGAARVLERHGLDYCCGGRRHLNEACAAAHVDAATVLAELDADDDRAPADWAAMGPEELVDHLEATHHAHLREELPRLSALAAKVEAAHGGRHPELTGVRATFEALRADLEPHLDKEEQVLFPLIRSGSVPHGPIAVMEHEHDRAAELLTELRSLSGGYEVPADGCASYRALYEGLAELEADTHLHVHKENNVLFPAVAG